MVQNNIKYWEETLQKFPDLQAVGYVSLGLPFNNWMYRVRKKIFLKTITSFNIKKKSSILDLGSGSGFYPILWRKRGFKNVTASDFTQSSVFKLKKLGLKVRLIDICRSKDFSKKYDLISAFDVLFHIVNDRSYAQAIKNISASLKPKGFLLFSENLKNHKVKSRLQVGRKESTIFSLLKDNGFEILAVKPIFFLMNTPVKSHHKFFKFYWKGLCFFLSHWHFLGYLIGPLLYPIETGLAQICRRGPSTELVIAQKNASPKKQSK